MPAQRIFLLVLLMATCAMPALTSDGLLVAAIDGTLTCLDPEGGQKWRKNISTYPIYADLVSAGDSVLVNDSDL